MHSKHRSVVCIYNFARDVSISRWGFFITYNLPELVLIIFPALVYIILYRCKILCHKQNQTQARSFYMLAFSYTLQIVQSH